MGEGETCDSADEFAGGKVGRETQEDLVACMEVVKSSADWLSQSNHDEIYPLQQCDLSL